MHVYILTNIMLCINLRIFEQFLEAVNPNITQREIEARIASDFLRWFENYVSIDYKSIITLIICFYTCDCI